MKKLLFIIEFIFLICHISAQEIPNLSFTRFDSKKGLATNEFKMIFQDKSDVMWFGTDIGLLQYDGYNFSSPSWLINTPYSNIEINAMTSDPKGNLYIATLDGLLIYSPLTGTLKIIHLTTYLKDNSISNNISSLSYDRTGKIWLGTFTGIYCYWLDKDSVSTYQIIDRQWKGSINVVSVMVSKKGEVWIGTWSRGLARFNKAKQHFECVYIDQKHLAENIKVIKEDKKGLLWVGSWKNGLFVLNVSNPSKSTIFRHFVNNPTEKNTIAGNIIFDLDFDKLNRVWIGTPYGLSILSGDLSKKPRFVNYQQNATQSTIANNEIRSVRRDRSGLIWLATWGGGINKVVTLSKEFKYYSIPVVDPLVKSQSVFSFTIDRKKRLLVGVQGLGFGAFDLKTKKYTLYSELPEYKKLKGIGFNAARCFAWDKDSNLWIGGRYKGIIKLDTKTGEYINLSNVTADTRFPVQEVFSMKPDEKGRMWVATNNGLYRIGQGKSGRFDDLEITRYYHNNDQSSLSDNYLSDVLIDDKGYLWVSSFNSGLNKSREKASSSNKLRFERFDIKIHPEYGLGTNKILCLGKDGSGKIWIGTVGKGLKYWNHELKRFEQPVLFEGMDDIVIFSFTEDSSNNIWITTNRGLVRIRHLQENYEIEQFSVDDGLQDNVFIKGAAFLDLNSNLFIGGDNGFNSLNSNQISIDKFIPRVLITNVKVENHDVNLALNCVNKPLIITHNDKYFTITFSTLDFFNPDLNKYAYKLEGFNDTWQYTNSNTRSASFGNLSPGKYKFILKGTNSHGKWNPEPTYFYIIVKTAPYKTWWAYTIYLLIICSLIYLFMSLRIKNIQIQKSLELENIKSAKIEEITHFKLQFFTNISHELLTPLSILKILTERWDESSDKKPIDFKGILDRNVSRLLTLINQILLFRKAETGNMKIKPQELDLAPVIQTIYTNYKILAEKKNILFQLFQPAELQCFLDVEKFDIILNNLLSNAIKYTPDGGTIWLKLSYFERKTLNWLRIEVIDNGIGMSKEDQINIFDSFYRIGQTNAIQSGIGIGLALTKNLVNLHGGSIVVESELKNGSTFIIELPVSPEFYQPTDIHLADPLINPDKIIQGSITDETFLKNYPSEKLDKVVLLVENEDDYRSLLKEQLENFVQVIACSNGDEALEIARNQYVEIVVSDLKMPVMNGYDLCKAIKSDINTNHIPFILITAFPDEKERYLGYESGIDSFLSKPLNINILISRIKSLLKKREEVQRKFHKGVFLEPEKIASSSQDERIILKAKNVIEANISDSEFSIIMLCDELGMSNSTLYRKMKSILNMKPNEFIRNIKLRRAAQLLEDPSFDISEAAYNTGFNDPSYFSTCFKKQYGVSPSAYQNGKRSPDDYKSELN